MEPNSETVDLVRWAKITIERWQIKIGGYGFGKKSTGALIRSFRSFPAFLSKEAQGDKAKITFAFLFYGYYWDAGVGNGYYRGNGGKLDSLSDWAEKGGAGHRKKHRWFNKIYWREFQKLKSLLAEQYGQEYINEMVQSIEKIQF